VRLSKCVAELKACSRREAELYIEGGWVRVAGIVVEEPQFRVHAEAITIDPHASPLDLPPVTLLLHKPPGFDAGTHEPVDIKGIGKGLRPALTLITPASQAADSNDGRPPATLLKKHLAQQVLCLPLESAASGLVVYTQDWRIERKLVEDARVIEQEFTVEVAGTVPPDTLHHLNHGLNDGGHPLPPVKISLSSSSADRTRLRCAIKGVHPGLIAYLCDRVGLQILSLKRIRVGRLPLSTLAQGAWRFLLPYERF
jgi:23S rRNA pseudouridine2604 synthase